MRWNDTTGTFLDGLLILWAVAAWCTAIGLVAHWWCSRGR